MTSAFSVSSQRASSPGASRLEECNSGSCDDGLSAFLSMRSRLFAIAYRMLGSAAEAEDIVQDVWLRWQTADRSAVRDAPAFLATATTRLAINVIQSARSRRETYVDPRLAGTGGYGRGRRIGSGTHRSVGVCGSDTAGEAFADGTSRIRPTGSLRLLIPRDCGHSSTRSMPTRVKS